jgi:hypothetical protein
MKGYRKLVPLKWYGPKILVVCIVGRVREVPDLYLASEYRLVICEIICGLAQSLQEVL